jgi:hypothetical protein
VEQDITELPSIDDLAALWTTIKVVVLAWEIGRGDRQSV